MQSGIVDTLTRRWHQAGYPAYPAWLPLAMDGCAAAAAVGSVAQRAGTYPMLPVGVLALVALSPWLCAVVGVRLPWPLCGGLTLGASAVMMVLFPMDYDFAILLLVMMVGHMGATESLPVSAVVTAASGAVLVTLDVVGELSGSKFWFVALVVGWDVGFVMQWQQRRLEEELRERDARESRVALEERQRIAREIHDVVAHSLSVTMLHLTAARRDLEDEAPDIPEAVDALREAERVGRQAMVDIRRTVGLLGDSGRHTTAPVPDLSQAPALVDEFRAAGLQVAMSGSLAADAVPAPVSLAAYRILQESLSNVAKHAPGSSVKVDVTHDGGALVLTVVNDVPSGAPTPSDGVGAGLRGMRERAELLGGHLSAGPDGETRWRVRLQMPLATDPRPTEPAAEADHCLPMRVLPRWAGEQS